MVKTKGVPDKDRAGGLDKSAKKRRLSATPPRVANGSAQCPKTGKSLRKLQMWTNEDTIGFFEAINEHGKDFPKIQRYIAQRCEKKGIPQEMIKTYEQVRHYYYRMWHKIANLLNINEVVDKSTQEIYGLINYGEIWKKFGTKFDNKLGLHLQQLINFGHTTFKVNGKRIRVKTPICKALKKIHKINVSENPKTNSSPNILNLPKDVTIELHPADNDSWLRVHSLSQNPRMKTKMSLQKRLSSLVEYLEKRWNPSRIMDAECRTICGTPLPNGQHTDNRCLRVRPHFSGDLNNVSLNKSLFNSQMDLSLTAYLKTLYNNELKGSQKKSKSSKAKDKELTADQMRSENNMKSPTSEAPNENSTVTEENGDKSNKIEPKGESECKSDEDEPIAEAERSLTLLKMLEKMNQLNEEINGTDEDDDKDDDDQNKDEEEEREGLPSPETNANLCLPELPANATLAQWLSVPDVDRDNNDIEEDNEGKTSNINETDETKLFLLSADRARKGWSLSECGAMTIGELYLLYRCPKKILLEYIWEPVVQNIDSNTTITSEEPIVSNVEEKESVSKEEDETKSSVESTKAKPCDLLHKLLMAADLTLQSLKRPNTSSSAQTQKKRRIKPTPLTTPLTVPVAVPLALPTQVISGTDTSSQLLSNVISNTIFNDSNSNDGTTKPAENAPKIMISDSISGQTERHDFIVPKTPAPKAVNKQKTRSVYGDPALIQEALRQLQSNKYTRRQRRPTPKPVFGQNKPLLPRGNPPTIVSSASQPSVSPQQPIYVIPSTHPIHITSTARTALTKAVPVVNMTTLSAIKAHAKTDSFDVILPQNGNKQLSHSLSGQTSVVINELQSSNIPVIQLKTIPSVTVPISHSSQDPKSGFDHSLKATALLSSKPVSVFETQKAEDRNESNVRHNSVDKTSNDIVLSQTVSNYSSTPTESIVTEDSTEKLINSNPHISSILEISLPEPPFADNSCSSLTEYSLNSKRPFGKLSMPTIADTTSHHKSSLRTDPTLPTSVSQSSSLASPPIDRKRTLLELPEHQWNNGESSDISLGTLLNACESPIKTVSIRDSHTLANDVDTNMSCLVDNSVDLMAKFEDLVKHVDMNSKST